MNSGVLDITNEERQRQVFLEALGGSDRIAAMVADDPLDPLYEFLKRETPPETSTIESYFKIKRDNPNWIESFTRKRLANENDKRNLCAALGEVRAYADLLQLPLVRVKPHTCNQGGTDFLITSKDDVPIVKVEVFTQIPRPHSADVIEESESHYGDGFVFKTTIREVTPFSNKENAKQGDTTALDAISKICAIKQDEEQIDEKTPTLYYVDLQTIIPEFSTLYNYKPISSFSGNISSGAYWHAMYGHCGDSVAEAMCQGDMRVSTMQHNGRFADDSKHSEACAFLFRETKTPQYNEDPLICFENPKKPLPESFVKSLKYCPLLNWEVSVMRIIQGDLCKFIDMQNAKIKRCIDAIRTY